VAASAAPRTPVDAVESRWSEHRWVLVLQGGRGRPFGLLLLGVLVALLLAPESPPLRRLRLAGFDTYHSLLPRIPRSTPALIVEIGERSLARHGQWPWPRTVLARLVSKIAEANPAAIGIDILMPERDRLSPGRLSSLLPALQPELADRLARLPDNDAVLAGTLRRLRVVLGVAGVQNPGPTAALSGLRAPPVRAVGGDPAPSVRRFPAALRSIEELDAVAAGHGLLTVDLEAGVVRRLQLLAAVGPKLMPTLMPPFGLEMLRVASGEPAILVHVGSRGIETVGVGDAAVPTEPDGSVWLHYSRHDDARFIEAADVLDGEIDRNRLAGTLVLVGVTAVGLSDYHATPVGDRMSGLEIHAQFIEGMLDGDLLTRPLWLGWVQAALLVAGGLLVVWAVPALPVRASAGLGLAVILLLAALGLLGYERLHVLFDAASPALALSALYAAMLGVTLAETVNQRLALRRQVERQREAAARLAGELEAARRIQMGSLPRPAAAFPGERRFDLYALLEPAREVGGDFYDFFHLEDGRVFFLIGDVSGKGLPGCLFMALAKSLCKSVAYRGVADLGAMMREADREIARDNAESLFVTMWAAILDAQTGALEYCSAGHDAPYRLASDGRLPGRFADGGGPPLCVAENFPYSAASSHLEPGETLCLFTDGVTEATNSAGEFFGRARLEALLAGLEPGATPTMVGEAIRGGVRRFAGAVEAADDLAIVILRWTGRLSAR
jgi:serine phosphatase RsbU (regulator of sigma subunit)